MSNYKWVCNKCKATFDPLKEKMNFNCPFCGSKDTNIIYFPTKMREDLRHSRKVRRV